jgi:hypothetical protein
MLGLADYVGCVAASTSVGMYKAGLRPPRSLLFGNIPENVTRLREVLSF